MNQQENNASNLFKQKRDEYLIEIRKKKNTNEIEAKRAKLTRASEQPEPLLNQSSIDYFSLPLNDLASAFITLLQAQNLTDLPNIARAIRIAVSNAEVLPIEELISTGVVPYMIGVLRPQFFSEAALLTECSWIIVNILSEDRYVKDMVQLDIIPIAMELLDHQVHDVKENAIWILSNIASDSYEYRMVMLQKNIAGKIGQLFEDKSLGDPIHNCLIWLISNLCMGKPDFSEVAPFLMYLQEFIKNCKKEKVVLRCVHALSYLTDTDDENQIQEIIDMDILDHLILYLKSGNTKLKAPVLRIIANIAAAHDDFLDILINAGFVETLYPLLDDEKPSIRREVSLVYSNFLAGRSLQITAVFMHDHGKILEKLFYMATHDIEEVAEECIFALCNASEGSDTEIRYLVDLGVIPVLVELFTKTQREDILKKCLEALKGILDAGSEIGYGPTPQDNPYFIKLAECNGLSVIEALLNFPSADVFNMVEEILREYTDKI